MKNFWTILSVVIVVVILLLSSVFYQVRKTETVIIKRFGKIVRTVDPGPRWKWPKPIEVVHRFDSRSRLLDFTPIEETTTAGGEPVIVKSYAVWAIAEPGTFLNNLQGDVENAEGRLKTLLENAQNSVVGKHFFSEFVNTNPEKIRFEQIENEITAEVRDKAMQEYGIAIKTVGIKRLNVPEDVTAKVFDRMKADRNRKRDTILAEGRAEAERIRSDAEAKQKELLAVAAAQAQLIRGTGDAEAARYYEMLKEDPELAMFLRNLEALKKILAEKTTIVLGVETEPIELLKGIPDIQPKSTSGAEN